MIEVLFSQSAAGGMLDLGAFNSVACLSLGLSMGDITAPLSDDRATFLQNMVPISGEEFADVGSELIRSSREGMERIRDAVQQGIPIRCWYSQAAPDEYCGLCHLLSELPIHAEVWAVELPAMVPMVPYEKHIIYYSGWGDVEPDAFLSFAASARKLSICEKRFFASLWRERAQENGPLRAIVNGRLQTVGVDFYDCFLRQEVDAAPDVFQEAKLIGDVLGKYVLGISDALVAIRLESWIQKGLLVPLTQPPEGSPIYHRLLGKVGNDGTD